MNALGIIPARYSSSRFPGKPLADVGGMSLVERVYRQAQQATCLQKVVVATDDYRILQHVNDFGGFAEMTRTDHATGTDRCVEIAAKFTDFDYVVNIQGDEPFIAPEQIDEVLQPLLFQSGARIATLAKMISRAEDIFNPNVVKVVLNKLGQAMYFSRSPIPFLRDVPQDQWPGRVNFYKHIGLYAFHRDTLLEISSLPQGYYEQAESLEQLRWLASGFPIAVAVTDKETLGIDTPADLQRALAFMEEGY
jgi:3-deoxy-manno-octulosonate cytidylyltransferase (CMP-KDO synthetase)